MGGNVADQRRRAALFEIRRDAQLCHRPRGGAGEWRCSAHRRAGAQEQDRLRSDRALRRLGRNARSGHGDHGQVAAVAAGARDVVGGVRQDVERGGRRCRRFSLTAFCRRRSRSRIISRSRPRDAIWVRQIVAPGNAHLLVEVDGQPETVQEEMEKLRELVAATKAEQIRRGDGGSGLRATLDVAARV